MRVTASGGAARVPEGAVAARGLARRNLCAFFLYPHPRGYLGDTRRMCTCTPPQWTRYRARLSGPLLDRIDLHVEVPRAYPRLTRVACTIADLEGVPAIETRHRAEAIGYRILDRSLEPAGTD